MDFPKFQRLVDMYNYGLKVGPGAVIEDISYFTTGCGFGTATCSLVVDLARGKTIDGASAITTEQVEAELDGYPEKKKDYPQRALEALHVAIDDYRAKIASGAIEDLSSLPARPVERPAPPVVAAVPDEKLLIKLH
jgi:NifU-like protein involved in Fe-S cluster formation